MSIETPKRPASAKGVAASADSFHQVVARVRHDLRGSLGHLLGFSEMLNEEAGAEGFEQLVPELEGLIRTANQMIGLINQSLVMPKLAAGLTDLRALQRDLSALASNLVAGAEALIRKSYALKNDVLSGDLARIANSARETRDQVQASLASLMSYAAGHPLVRELAAVESTEPVSERAGPPDRAIEIRREGSILVVDDMDDNRQLLLRRLAPLGYSVQLMTNGRNALEYVATNAVDLILLDIVMPELDGFSTLKALKAMAATQHIPVVMLSSADEIETIVRCIQLGADDFIPKPFNSTLLMARIESSLAKKRLRDQEQLFVKRLRFEQDRSENLLLNILPKQVADRLKQGESVIADHYSDVTVMFTDFVGFTSLSSGISAKELVRNLNEIFTVFDQLCDQHGLEKIKTIGDAYMAVGGLPTPLENHAEAVAEAALAMQEEMARASARSAEQFKMRIGMNTGPVVAGIIGARKFAYDLWGDTVNTASRMETNSPVGGILVTAATYERLKHKYRFKRAKILKVKGKGDMATYQLLGRA